jgi:HlyD family secretion protein
MPAQPEKRGGAALGVAAAVVALAIGFILGGAAIYMYGHTIWPAESSGSAQPSEVLDKVVALGRIEPEDGVLSLGVPTPDRIAEIKVEEGAHVKKNQELVVLDSKVLRDLERQLAVIQRQQAEKRLEAVKVSGDAQVQVEQDRLDQIKEVGPLEIEAQDSKIKFLQAQEKNARKDYERYTAAGDTVAEQDKEKQRLLLEQIQTELIAAQCQYKKMLKSQDLNRRAAKAQLNAAKAERDRNKSAISLELLDKQVEQADERVKETRLYAPSAGKILRILVRAGELVRGQPILQMANTERMIVMAEVYETDIQRVRVGQKATITSHIFKRDDALTGKVVWKGSSIGKAQVIDLDPRAAVDNRVVDVKIQLDQSNRVADLIGHQVRVEIETSSGGAARLAASGKQ